MDLHDLPQELGGASWRSVQVCWQLEFSRVVAIKGQEPLGEDVELAAAVSLAEMDVDGLDVLPNLLLEEALYLLLRIAVPRHSLSSRIYLQQANEGQLLYLRISLLGHHHNLRDEYLHVLRLQLLLNQIVDFRVGGEELLER